MKGRAGQAERVDAKITNWPKGRDAAVSLTFDDGVFSQHSAITPKLEDMGFRGTFFVPVYLESHGELNWDAWKMAAARGHEIGSHTMTHPWLTDISESELRYQLKQSRLRIMDELGLEDELTLAYPAGKYNDRVVEVTADYYLAARTNRPGIIKPDNSPDFFRLPGYPWRTRYQAPAMNDNVEKAVAEKAWIIELAHGMDDESWEPLVEEVFDAHLDFLKSKENENQVWVDTFSAIARYMMERKSVEVSAALINQNSIEVTLQPKHGLPKKPIALTVSVPLPNHWSSATTEIAGQRPDLEIRGEQSGRRHALVDVVPADLQVKVQISGS